MAIDGAEPGDLDPARLDLCGRFLRHRLDRGSVVLAGAAAATWRQAARLDVSAGTAIEAFLDACEVVDRSLAAVDAEGVRARAAPLDANASARRAWTTRPEARALRA